MPQRCTVFAVVTAMCWLSAALAHDLETPTTGLVLVETDLGLDDAVTLALALQAPHLDIGGIVSVAGAMDSETGAAVAATLLDRFNRSEIPLWIEPTPISEETESPAIRSRLGRVYPDMTFDSPGIEPRAFSSRAYGSHTTPVTVLALGPLTATARAVRDHHHIARIVISGPPDPERNWNLKTDPESWSVVRSSGIPLIFVDPEEDAEKPQKWSSSPGLGGGLQTSLAQDFAAELFADPDTRAHYLEAIPRLCDELALLYLLHPEHFVAGGPDVVRVGDREGLLDDLDGLLRRGRQSKDRVVFTSDPFPDNIFQPDVGARRAAVIARNGEDEWFAQLLLNEMHEHLGAYSIIGVKMGLRAAELLNAPPHSMEVVSAAPPRPPVSCLNDGLLMATGSTPGRGLFRHHPADAVRAAFAFNGRRVTLELRQSYRRQIAEVIRRLRSEHGLEDPRYWAGVRKFGLEIWQDWHRLELFDVTGPRPTKNQADSGE